MPAVQLPYSFPTGPNESAEWPGSDLGKGNIITRIKGRTSLHDKTLDRDPTARDALLTWAEQTVRDLGGAILTHDAVVHGVRVRLLTNSHHQHDFFVRNWYGPDDWEASSGQLAPTEPHLLAYALIGMTGRPEAAYYSRERNFVLFTNSSYYGQLKSWVLGAVGRMLSEDRGIHSIHGACVELEGKGILYVAPTGTGKSTSSYGLMALPGSRFHSDDWVYVRYALPTRGGTLVSPTSLPGPRGTLHGYQAVHLLLNGQTRSGRYAGYDLLGTPVEGTTDELDLEAPLQAYAYTSERWFYLRSNLVESFAPAAPVLLNSVFENVPDVSPAYLEEHAAALLRLEEELRATGYPIETGHAGTRAHLARMIAFDNARAMLDTTRVFGVDRVFANPLHPTRLSVVFLLERDFATDRVIDALDEPTFLGALLDGTTPTGTHETAYNAYRAVDDTVERAFIDSLGGTGNVLGSAFLRRRGDAPATLAAEMVLFSALHRATHCYALNTILQRDPAVNGRKEAVHRTLALIAAAARGTITRSATISDYQAFI